MAVNPDKRITDLLLPAFLSYLRRQGFIIGIDHYLRLQELLVKMGPHCPPGDLKYLLCPLFATGEKQQRQFYRAFDSFFKSLHAYKEKEIPPREPRKHDRETPEEPGKPKRWQYVLLAALLLILAAMIFHRLGDKPVKKSFLPGKDIAAADKTGTTDQDQESQSGQAQEENIDKPGKKKKWTYRLSFLEKYGYIIHGVAFLAPFIIFLLVEIYQYNRRRLVLLKKRGKKPPYVWPIRVETPGTNLVKNETFYRSARLMRKRLKSDTRVLDIDKTVDASIERAGFPGLRHKVLTRPPEYLMLIDLPAYRDHYSQLFDTIAGALEKEGLYVTRYFYEKDPRICFKEPGQSRVYLTQLQSRYSDSRLIICGDGVELLDPLTGDLDGWTVLFRAWRERAILTPLPPKQWRMREIELASEFILLPASIRALGTLAAYFQAPDRTGAKVFTQEEWHTSFLTPGTENDIETLREYLGKDTYQWLCACAVWPELHWDLTLYLGSLPCMPGNLISEENLLRLLRLPWFRTGAMPEELRWELMTALDKEIHQAIRSALIDLLEKDPAPQESAAYDDYRLNVVVHRLLLSRLDPKKRKERLNSLKEFNEMRIERDYTLVRFLESTPGSPLQMVLPQRLRKIFYKKGVPFFGFKTVFRVALTVIAAAAAFLFLKPAPMDMPLEVRYIESLGITVYQNEKKCWEADYGDEIKMVYIEPGEFKMGQTIEEKKWLIEQLGEKSYNDYYKDETPLHPVYLDGYWMGKTEVTVGQFKKFISDTGNKSLPDVISIYSPGDDYPVVEVSWNDANAYCQWLSDKKGINFKLPTEAQWEKAARGVDNRKYPWGNHAPYYNGRYYTNYAPGNPKEDGYVYAAPVDSFPQGASPYGILNMAGNVWEWCNDWYDENYYSFSPIKNPKGSESGSYRVVRGGSWQFEASFIRCPSRLMKLMVPDSSEDIGFRLCMEKEWSISSESFKSGFIEIQPGFEYLEKSVAVNSDSFSVRIVRVDQSLYEFRVLGRDIISDRALSLIEHQRKTEAICVINGGFRKSFDAHETIGLLIIDGKLVNPLTKEYSGIFGVNNKGAFILYKKDFRSSKDYNYALQAYPVIVDNGGQISVGLQPDKVFHRSFVAIDKSKRIILGTSTPVTLYDLATYLSKIDGLNCTVALNLEGGGGVVGMVIKFKKFYNKIGVTDYPVPNAIAVYRK